MHHLGVALLNAATTDRPEAYTWLFAASALGSAPSRDLLHSLEGKLPREDIVAAEKSARALLERLPKNE